MDAEYVYKSLSHIPPGYTEDHARQLSSGDHWKDDFGEPKIEPFYYSDDQLLLLREAWFKHEEDWLAFHCLNKLECEHKGRFLPWAWWLFSSKVQYDYPFLEAEQLREQGLVDWVDKLYRPFIEQMVDPREDMEWLTSPRKSLTFYLSDFADITHKESYYDISMYNWKHLQEIFGKQDAEKY